MAYTNLIQLLIGFLYFGLFGAMVETPLNIGLPMLNTSDHQYSKPSIPLKNNIEAKYSGDIRIYLPETAINDSDRKEFLSNKRFEDDIKAERRGEIIFQDILRKSDFIRTFIECLYALEIGENSHILELGADHGWASVLLKSRFPHCHVVVSDLVPDCVYHSARYEQLMQVTLDEKWSFSVRDIPFADSQFDRVFTFAAFHHFGDHGDYEESLKEIARIVKPGGRIVLLYEPSSPRLFHKAAHSRANRNRAIDGVDEDVLIPNELFRLGRKLGLSVKDAAFPFYMFRPSIGSSLYYYIVAKSQKLQNVLPCTHNYVLTKLS
jgi:SAM-dependent methyltransferase